VPCPLVPGCVTPPLWFLSISPRVCSTLPSEPVSRRRPCAALSLRLHPAGKRTFTSKLCHMLGTHAIEVSGAALCAASGYSRRGDRSPRLCCKTVRATFAAHGFSGVWRLARVPATLLRRVLQVAIPMPQLPVCRFIPAASCAGEDVVDFSHVAHLQAVSARPASPLLRLQQSRRSWLDGRVVA
jgi:hypothetical protein